MRYSFIGKNIVISDSLKERATHKIDRLEKLFPVDTDVLVTFSVVKHDNTMEVSIPLGKRMLRAEVTKDDMYSAIDEAVDILEKQMVKYKSRLKDKSRRDGSFKAEMSFIEFPNEENTVIAEPSSEIKIERTKKFALKPMDEEEAVMEMEMLGHTFFVFRNSKTNEVNVVYKRKEGYGLICPEVEE